MAIVGHGDRFNPLWQGITAVPATRKDGTRISVEFSMVLVRSSVGEILGSAAIIRDVRPDGKRRESLGIVWIEGPFDHSVLGKLSAIGHDHRRNQTL